MVNRNTETEGSRLQQHETQCNSQPPSNIFGTFLSHSRPGLIFCIIYIPLGPKNSSTNKRSLFIVCLPVYPAEKVLFTLQWALRLPYKENGLSNLLSYKHERYIKMSDRENVWKCWNLKEQMRFLNVSLLIFNSRKAFSVNEVTAPLIYCRLSKFTILI